MVVTPMIARSSSPLRTVQTWRYGALLAVDDAMPYHGDCEDPVTHEIRGADSHLLHRLRDYASNDKWDYADGYGHIGVPSALRTATAYVKVRCRKCECCLRQRQRLWTARAIAETRVYPRTWFGTLTFSPDWRFRVQMQADKRSALRRREPLSSLASSEQYGLLVQEASPYVTKWLKRIRKEAKARLRYLLVSEAHADGFPHYHLLLHEIEASAISKRRLEAQWYHGFSHWRLIERHDPRAVYYATKYLSKNAQTRVRASQRYGQGHKALLSDAIASLSSSLEERKEHLRLSIKGTKG